MKYPVLVWEDVQGGRTAALVEFPKVAAHAADDAEALMQLRELLAWQTEHEPWRVGFSDFEDPELFTVKVPVRPEYRVDSALPSGWTHAVPDWMGKPLRRRAREDEKEERVYAMAETVTVRVVAVRGRQESGMWACAVPTLELCFYSARRESLKDLVIHYVQDALAGETPQALAGFLEPPDVRLDHVLVRAPRPRATRSAPSLPTLGATATAMGDSGFRRGFMRAYGRVVAVESLRRRLADEKANLLLVGPHGVGKTALLVDAVTSVERQGARRRFWQTSAGRLMAGMRWLGQWQQRCEALIDELDEIDGVLCVERLVDLVRLGGCGPEDGIAAFLAPYLARGELRMVMEATAEELDACRRLLPGFVELFALVAVEPFPSAEEAGVLGQVAAALEKQTRVGFGDGVAASVARLFRRFMPYAGFPGRAVAFMRGLVQDGAERVSEDDVLAAFTRQTGLPEILLRDDMPLDVEEVRLAFREQVVGQEEACEAAVGLVTTFKAALHDPGRPLGVMLFCGPTGVGKTEMARALGRWFFGEDRLVRLDMSEYGGVGAADRLLGISGGERGPLIRRLREQPFSVVLLDEIEKADPEVFDVLLGVFDEGRLRDAYGRVTTFRGAVLVMTSNLGADALRSIGLTEKAEPTYEAEVMSFFRPEFFNRLDAVVRFRPLTRELVRLLAVRELRALGEREGMRAARLRLEWDESVIERIVDDGYDPRYGARPLQRAVDAVAGAPLGRFLAERPGLREVTLRVGDGGIRVTRQF
jgi:ATP-dependent Clp protease ATP-binding subunit ClpC